MMDPFNYVMYAVMIRRTNGEEFMAFDSCSGPALFHGIRSARKYKRELQPQFKCRVARVHVVIKELVKVKKNGKKKEP